MQWQIMGWKLPDACASRSAALAYSLMCRGRSACTSNCTAPSSLSLCACYTLHVPYIPHPPMCISSQDIPFFFSLSLSYRSLCSTYPPPHAYILSEHTQSLSFSLIWISVFQTVHIHGGLSYIGLFPAQPPHLHGYSL